MRRQLYTQQPRRNLRKSVLTVDTSQEGLWESRYQNVTPAKKELEKVGIKSWHMTGLPMYLPCLVISIDGDVETVRIINKIWTMFVTVFVWRWANCTSGYDMLAENVIRLINWYWYKTIFRNKDNCGRS